MDMCCNDFRIFTENNPDTIGLYPEYGYMLKWIEISKENSFSKIHKYGTQIKYCPFCGQLVNSLYV